MRLFVYGTVQGVGFRPTVYTIAKSMNLAGYVRNNGSNVEIVIDKNYEEFISRLKKELPPLARIESVKVDPSDDTVFQDFTILPSITGAKISTIPTDTAICDKCYIDLFEEKNRRFNFAFVNCTDCGARYSIIRDLPYDRHNTSMDAFPLCRKCQDEYQNPINRRFHAQTISCPSCGPTYTLYDSKKKEINGDGISLFAKYLDEGEVGVIKSWGGMHICCVLSAVERLRKIYQRPEKPFAVMMRDLNAAKKYAKITKDEEVLLTSSKRPIVLVQKNSDELDKISPGLDTIGVFLPYTGVHHLLFSHLKDDFLIMTSANRSGEPIILENSDVFDLGVDYYLLHNREIYQRCDDSLIRMYKGRTFFIRKSRGYVPLATKINHSKNVLAVGAERNVSASISKDGCVYVSQYIGNTRHYPTLLYLEDASRHLINLLGINFLEYVGCDLHPHYATRKTAKMFSEEYGVELVGIQHHWAHAASLALDNKYMDPYVALSIDGAGYGDDGKMWGAEILLSSFDSYTHLGTIEDIPLIGGDQAVYDPKRLVFALQNILGIDSHYFDQKTAFIFSKMIKNSPKSTGLGRVLDAVSCYLGVSDTRTYDGEPAMKLETYLNLGKNNIEFDIESKGSDPIVVQTHSLFEQLFSKKIETKKQKADVAYSFVHTLMTEMANQAVNSANEHNIDTIGITGGVSYNRAIVEIVENVVKKNNMNFLTHNRFCNGDGGISIGQNAIIGNKEKKNY